MKISGYPSGANYAPLVPRRPPPAPQAAPEVDAIGGDGDHDRLGARIDLRL